jgi:hypothetical protein
MDCGEYREAADAIVANLFAKAINDASIIGLSTRRERTEACGVEIGDSEGAHCAGANLAVASDWRDLACHRLGVGLHELFGEWEAR